MSTLKINTLEVTNDKAYEIMDQEVAYLYSDNGGDCDGNANFPSEQVENDAIVKAGLGRYSKACYYTGNDFESISENLRIRGFATPEHFAEQRGSDEVVYEDVKEALYESTVRWSGYGNGETIVVEW